MGFSYKRTVCLLSVLVLPMLLFGQSIVQVIPLPNSTYWNNAWGLTADSTNLYISSNTSDATFGRRVLKLNFSGQPVDSITLPAGVVSSQGLARDGDGNLYYLRRYTAAGTIMKFSPTGALLDSVRLPPNKFPGGLAWDGTHVWFSIYSPDVEAGLYKLNFSTHQVVDTILVPTLQPYGIAWNGTHLLYVENGFQGDPQGVFKVNPVTGDTAGFIPAPVDPNGTRPNSVAWDGHYMWLLAEPVGANTGRSLYKYDLGGSGTPDIVLVPPGLDFGNRRLNTRHVDSIQIQNVGTAQLRVDSISSIPAGVWDTDLLLPLIVAPNTSATMRFGFRPNLFGVYSLFVALHTNDPDEQIVNLNVRGVGIYGPPTISTLSDFDFAARRVGSSSSWLMTIQNQGAERLSISSITIPNHVFRVDSVGLPLHIDSLGSKTLRVWFIPSSAATFVDTLRIASNASNGVITNVVLRGTGDATPIPINQPFWTYTVPNNPRTSSNSKLVKAVRAISDITGDGKPDVVVSCENYWTMALNGNASVTNDSLWAFNTYISSYSAGSIGSTGDYSHQKALAVADLNQDSYKDVIIGTGGGNEHVYALNGRNGQILWQFGTDHPDSFSLGDITGVDASTDFTGDGVPEVIAAAAATDAGGVGGRRSVYQFNGANGSIRWISPLLGFTHGVAAIGDVTGDGVPDVVGGVGEPSYKASAYSGANGALLWNFPLTSTTGGGKEVLAWPVAFQTSDVIVSAFWGPVYRVDGELGTQVWSRPTGGSGVMQLVRLRDVTGDGVDEILAPLLGGGIYCVNGANGNVVWSLPTGNTMGVAAVPDLNGDGFDEAAIAVQNQGTMIAKGQDGSQLALYATGTAQTREVAAVPDMDWNNSFEVIMGGQQGNIALLSGGSGVSSVGEHGDVPDAFSVGQNYPNPFNPSTTIEIKLPVQSDFSLTIFDILGRNVRTYDYQHVPAGGHKVTWDGNNSNGSPTASGVYFYRFVAGQNTIIQRMLLLK